MSDQQIICTCENITRQQVIDAVKSGHHDFRSLRRELNIAAECGNCHRPILKVVRSLVPRKQPITRPLSMSEKTQKYRHFPMPWKHFSHAKLEQEYSPSSCIDDIMVYIQGYIDDSASAKQQLNHQASLSYGDKRSQSVDYFPGAPGAPLVIYIHGGYWQELSKNESCFMATPLNAKGYHLAVIDYTLAPMANIHSMLQECCQAIAWMMQQEWQINEQEIILSGSSAGAHLAACVLQAAANNQQSLHTELFNQAILFSGVYDLRPLVGTYVNEPLGLDMDQAASMSPGLASNRLLPSCLIVWGANETGEFKRQSQQFAQFLEADGVPTQSLEIAQRNHFDVVYELPNLLPRSTIARKSTIPQ